MRVTDLVESEGTYTRFYFSGNAPTGLSFFEGIESRLNPATCFRANRSQIVNLSWIETVGNGIEGRLTVKMRNGKRIEISRRQSRTLRELLNPRLHSAPPELWQSHAHCAERPIRRFASCKH